MAYRHRLNRIKDNHKFTNTAKKVKKINVAPKVSRGGIML